MYNLCSLHRNLFFVERVHIQLANAIVYPLHCINFHYTPGIGKIVPRNVIYSNLNNKRLTTSEWSTEILTIPS